MNIFKPFIELGSVLAISSVGAICVSKIIFDDDKHNNNNNNLINDQNNQNTSINCTDQIDNIIDYNIDLLKAIQWLNQQCVNRTDKIKFLEFEKKLTKLIKLEKNLDKLKPYHRSWFLLGFEYKHHLNSILMYFQARFFSEDNKKYFKLLRDIIGDLSFNIQLENTIDLETRKLK